MGWTSETDPENLAEGNVGAASPIFGEYRGLAPWIRCCTSGLSGLRQLQRSLELLKSCWC